jgi:hypothetical protein
MMDLAAVQGLLAGWWFEYDEGEFDAFPRYFTQDARFSCRSDSGATPFEDFIQADVRSRDEVVAWQVDHRRGSPYPLRHNATNVHLTASRLVEVDFRSYLFVTHVVGGAVANLASGRCGGTARLEEGAVRFAELRVVLDFTDSEVFATADRHPVP